MPEVSIAGSMSTLKHTAIAIALCQKFGAVGYCGFDNDKGALELELQCKDDRIWKDAEQFIATNSIHNKSGAAIKPQMLQMLQINFFEDLDGLNACIATLN
eukprot:scaffold440655_cov14-Prasinocladus_malaysianus.AAC.1